MAERVGMTVNTHERYEAVQRDSLDGDGKPQSFSFGSDHQVTVELAVHRRQYGLSPETHTIVRATWVSASVSTWSQWQEVSNADA